MQDKVLIIEDTRSFASLLQNLLLEKLGVESDIAETKQDADLKLSHNAASYFASIVDLSLPDAPKGEATDAVVDAGIPAIVFTGTNDQAVKEDLWERGITDYAHKSGSHSLEYVCWIIDRLRKNVKVKILVVDDSKVAQRTMAKLLKTQRYQVFISADGEEALDILDDHPDICVAILDCYMQGIDGFELAARMREKRSRDALEIIGVSSHGGRSISAKFIKSGANDYLLKPFIPEEFLCRVNHAAERIERYNELRQLNQRKNQLIGTAAHDIRGPVGAIKTATHYILKRDPEPERREHLIKMVETSAEGLLDLLGDVLDVASIEGGELKLNLVEDDLSTLVQERVSLYLAQAEEKNLQIRTNLQSTVSAEIDSIKIRQVVDNLLTNAIKYCPPGATIEVNLSESDHTISLSVEDSGPGINEQEQQDLFVPFKVLSSRATGGETASGLGLAIVKKLIQAHGGSINYKNSNLGGAGFFVYLEKTRAK